MTQSNLYQTNALQIQIQTINHTPVETVDARDLHSFLEAGDRPDQWITRRIELLGLEEDVDYTTFAQTRALGLGRPLRHFFFTLEAAKHISMAERNERGKQARAYFIKIEDNARELLPQLQQQNQQLLNAFLSANPLYNKIVRYSQLGLNVTETAKLCDMSVVTLLQHRIKLADLGLIDPPKKLGCTLKRNFTLAEIDHMIELYNQGLSFTAIGKQFKCSYKTVKRRVNEVKHALNRNKTAHMA